MDFSLLLVIATALTGLVWAAHAVFFRSARDTLSAGAEPAGRSEPVLVEYARSFFPVLLIVLIVRSFAYEPFRIPSSSMMPTLLVGDFIFVNKYKYGLRLPVTNTKIVGLGDPERGDVVVFRLPADPATNYIKRLVGLPGDIVEYRDKQLTINGQEVELELTGEYTGERQRGSTLGTELLGSAEHEVLLMSGRRSIEGRFVVPEGHFFMMGDNRDNSRDSRYPGVGLIPESNIVGKAVRVWMNWDFPTMPMWSRVGDAID
jgi:signal peptidase I